MSNPTELLPCPFCNGAPVIKQRDYEYRVECENRHTTCPVNMRTHYHVETDDAWRDWNTRTPAAPPNADLESFKEAIQGTFSHESYLKSELVAIARELFYKGHTTLVTRIEECAKQVDVVARHTAAKAVEHTRKVIVSDAVKLAVEDERQRLLRLVEDAMASIRVELPRLDRYTVNDNEMRKSMLIDLGRLETVRQWLTGEKKQA